MKISTALWADVAWEGLYITYFTLHVFQTLSFLILCLLFPFFHLMILYIAQEYLTVE